MDLRSSALLDEWFLLGPEVLKTGRLLAWRWLGNRRNAEQLIWTRLVALLVHLIATLQWEVELIP